MIGRVYVIYSESKGLAYYGSTIQTLEERFSDHESARKAFEKGTHNYVYSFKVLDCGDAKIELVKEIDYDFDYELTELEGLYIKNYPCVNHYIAGRTRAEWYHDNREQINKQKKVKYTCQCGGKYTYSGKSLHEKTNMHQQFLSQQTATLTAHEMRPLSPQLPSTSSLRIAV